MFEKEIGELESILAQSSTKVYPRYDKCESEEDLFLESVSRVYSIENEYEHKLVIDSFDQWFSEKGYKPGDFVKAANEFEKEIDDMIAKMLPFPDKKEENN